MHIAHVSGYRDPRDRPLAELIRAWPTLTAVAHAVSHADVRVSIVQATAHDDDIDVEGVHVHGVATAAFDRIARFVQRIEADVVHLHGLAFARLADALRRALPHTPILVQDHADRPPRRIRRGLVSQRLRGIDAVAFTAASQADPFLPLLPPAVTVVEVPESSSHFTPGDRAAARSATGLHGAPCVLWVGRLAAVKDPLTAFAAFRALLDTHPDARLWCCFGDAPLRAAVDRVLDADATLRNAVTLLGAVPHEEIEPLLRATDIYLAASRSEGSGYALIEAMACGALPVVSDIPSFRTLAQPIAELFPAGDVDAAAAALRRAAERLTHDATRARSAVRAHFDAHASFSVIGQRLRTAYAQLVDVRRRRRVVMLVPGGVDRTGTHRVIPALLAQIERIARATDLHVLALRQEATAQRYPLLGATVHCVPHERSRALPAVLATTPRALRLVRRLHAQRRVDNLHAVWAHPQGTIAALAGRAFDIPILLHLNGGDAAALPRIGFGGLATRRGRALIRLAAAAADVVTAPSGAVVDDARDAGIHAERVTYGVALDRWPPREPQPRSNSRARVLHVGSLNRVKDQRTLLAAAAILRRRDADFHLDIVGGDTLDGAVQAHARELALDHVVAFHDVVTHDALRTFFEDADVLVISSLYEGDPIVALEAAVAGIAVVGTAVGHLREWAPHAALAVPPGDADALADAIDTVLNDDALRIRLARNAQQLALTHDADTAARRNLELYQSVYPAQRTHEPNEVI